MNTHLKVIKQDNLGNNAGYSDEWQEFTGNYDAFEYDLRLHNGEIVRNCFPGPGIFECASQENRLINHEEIGDIRFSELPMSICNLDISPTGKKYIMELIRHNPDAQFMVPKQHPLTQAPGAKQKIKGVPFVNLNKTGRNEPCACGSGKKYKNCCL